MIWAKFICFAVPGRAPDSNDGPTKPARLPQGLPHRGAFLFGEHASAGFPGTAHSEVYPWCTGVFFGAGTQAASLPHRSLRVGKRE